MKRVYTNSDQVIHLFSQQTQYDARCTNVFFEGKKIYSYGYHYLLAEFIGNNAILINDLGYSVTTSKHISSVSYATKQYKQFYKSKTDLKEVAYQIEQLTKKLVNARKPEKYIIEIISLYDSVLEYAKFRRTLTKIKKTEHFKTILKAYKLVIGSDLKAFQEKEKKRIEKKVKQKLEAFYNYDIQTLRLENKDFLRLSEDKTKVETSQGVKIEINKAKKLALAIKKGFNIVGTKIDYYTINSYNNGILKAGCHTFDKNSLKKIITQLS